MENVRYRLMTNVLSVLLVIALLLPLFSTNIFAVDDVPLKVEYTYYTNDEYYSRHLRGERSYSMSSVLRANDRDLVNRGLKMAPSCIEQSAYECSHRIEKFREKSNYLYRIKYNFSPRFFNISCYIDGQKVAGAARRYGYSYRQKPISKKGYVFSGWRSSDVKRIVNGSFVMPGHNVTLTGSLVPRNDTPYRVEFYQQDLGKQSYTKIGADTITGEGTTDTRIRDDLNLSALKSKYTGYDLTASSLADNTKIEGDGTSVLKLYYDTVAPNVTYKFEGKLPKKMPNLPETAPHIYKSTVPVSETPSLPGYDFSGWTSDDVELSGGSFIMPDHKVIMTGTWIPHSDTPYTVEYYQQQLDGTYTLTSTENCKGTTDTKTNSPKKNYDGFEKTDSSKNTESTTTIDGDGSTVLQLYYDRSKYTVAYTYLGETDTTPPMLPVNQTFRYGESVTVSDTTPMLQGYNFGGWTSTDIDLSSKSFIMPDKDVSITGAWIPHTDTPYVVEYYQQNLENDDYTLLDTVNGKGVTGDVIPDVHHEYEGFIETEESKDAEATKIASDGSTVVKLYYDRNLYDVSYRYAGETDTTPPELPEPGAFRYGETVTASETNPTLQGYTFDGWKTVDINVTEGSFTMPSRDVSFIGTWIPRDDTPYTVMYYEQNLENDDYTLIDTVNGTGVTGNTIANVHRHYAGFTETDVSKEAGETTIASDGSTVAKLYYDRNSYQVTYQYSGETDTTPSEPPETATFRYGETVTVSNSDPTLQGYDFGGWKTTDVAVSNDTFLMPAKDVTITGAWYPQNGTPYTVRYYLQNLENSEYSLKDTVNGKGVTGSNIPSMHRNYEGFTPTEASIAAEKTKIASDGSTVVELYYERQSYPVTYEISEQDATENKYAPKDYKFGSIIVIAVEPEHKDGYPFSGWVTDDATIENGAFTMPSHAVVITGSFRHPSSGNRESKISFETNGGTKVEPVSADTGTTFSLKQMTAKTGYCFMGWATRSGGKVVYHVGDKLTVSKNLVLYAVFTKDVYIQGYIDGTFRPDEYLTKREANLMLSRLNVLSDLSGEDYITTKEFYLAASELGVVPLDDKKERYLTRAEAVTVLNEALEYQAEDVLNSDRKFKDVPLDHWAYSAIMIAAN